MSIFKITDTPDELFKQRTRRIQDRIQTLQQDLNIVVHPQVKRAILIELDNLIDDYIQRRYALERKNENNW